MINEKGSALVFASVIMAGLLAFSGAVIDIGLMLHQRTKMQMAADSAALAGAKGFTENNRKAIAEAETVARNNGYVIDSTHISFPTDHRVRVAWSAPAGLVMAPFFKLFNITVGVQSVAEFSGYKGGEGIVPIGVPKRDFTPGKEYILKPGPGSPNNHGNFAPLRIDCAGAENYKNHIINGSNLDIKVGDYLYTEPGNMVGPTEQGFSTRIGNDQTAFEDALSKDSPRLVTVPLIDNGWWDNSNGLSPELVVGFAHFYITYTAKGEVHGRFVDQLNDSVVSATGTKYAVKLVE